MKTERVTSMKFEKKNIVPQTTHAIRVRLAAMALAVSGVLFVLYPAIRPFSDETSLFGAAAFASTEWIVAHMLAMMGFILLTLGLFGLYISLKETKVQRFAFRGLVLSWLGTSLTLPFYGAEAFGLHEIGQEAIRQHSPDLVSLANDVRFGPGFVMILMGLVLLAVGSIMAATAVWKSSTMSKWSGIPFTLGFLLYLPQFVGTQPIRVAHGLLVAVGCLWMATGMWAQSNKESELNSGLPEQKGE
jgi:hypothetical protein